MKTIFKLAVTLAMLFLPVISIAQVPQMISYQGFLTDPAGNPITDSVMMTFTIYDSPEDEFSFWSGDYWVGIWGGLCNVQLGGERAGPIPPEVFNGDARWLGITVESEPEMVPRTQLVSVPYSYVAATAGNADMVDDYHAGNAAGQVAASNGTLCTNLNADMVDGSHSAAFAQRILFSIPTGGGSTTFIFPHFSPFTVTVTEAFGSPTSNAVGFVHCIENDDVIAWKGIDGAGVSVGGSASLWGVTTILTVGAGIILETPGDGSNTLRVRSTANEDVRGIVVY